MQPQVGNKSEEVVVDASEVGAGELVGVAVEEYPLEMPLILWPDLKWKYPLVWFGDSGTSLSVSLR